MWHSDWLHQQSQWWGSETGLGHKIWTRFTPIGQRKYGPIYELLNSCLWVCTLDSTLCLIFKTSSWDCWSHCRIHQSGDEDKNWITPQLWSLTLQSGVTQLHPAPSLTFQDDNISESIEGGFNPLITNALSFDKNPNVISVESNSILVDSMVIQWDSLWGSTNSTSSWHRFRQEYNYNFWEHEHNFFLIQVSTLSVMPAPDPCFWSARNFQNNLE